MHNFITRLRMAGSTGFKALLWVGTVACGGQADPAQPEARVFDDAFDDGDLDGWTAHNPALANTVVDAGALVIEPNAQTLWYNSRQSVQYYQLASGDFALTADVTITNLLGGTVPPPWRLGGLQIRDPSSPGVDAYHGAFGTVNAGLPVFETKNTDDSQSQWWTVPNPTGTGQIRVCRAGSTVRAMFRPSVDEAWVVADERERPDLPATVAAGPIAFNGTSPANTRLRFDNITWASIDAIADCDDLSGGGDEGTTGSAGTTGGGDTGSTGDGTTSDGTGTSGGETTSSDGSTGGADGTTGTTQGTTSGSGSTGGDGSTGAGDGSTGATDGGSEESSGGADDGSVEPPACVSSFDGSGDISTLDDEFDDPSSLSCWTFRSDEEGTEPQFSFADVDASDPGHFAMAPANACGWFNDYDGPFVYKQVTGDFMFEVQVAATAVDDDSQPPSRPFNSAGMMVRNPDTGPGNENYILFNVGAQWNALLQTETKTTVDSASALQQTPGTYRGRLRICRLGDTFYLARRLVNEASFSLIRTYVRADLPDTLQAGVALTAWNGHQGFPNTTVDPDLRGSWDYVRFSPLSAPDDCLAESTEPL